MLEAKISQKLTLHAKKCLKEAQSLTCQEIKPKHLLYAICLEDGCLGNMILKNMGINKNCLDTILFASKKNPALKPKFSNELVAIITKAYYLANNFRYPYVGTEHLVYALLESNDKEIEKILERSTPKLEKNMGNILGSSINSDSLAHLSKIFDLPEITLSKNKSGETGATPYLNQFCSDLNNDTARRGEIIIGREKEIERIINILGRKNKNNPVLIGDPGVGKTALISKLAQRINSGDVPSKLINKKILSLDMALIVAGTSFRGEFEARIKEIIHEATGNRNVILFIDEIHTVIGAGNLSGGLDAANILKPALSRGDIQCIGATTISEYKKHFEKDPALERRFEPLKIDEPSAEETKKILEGIRKSYEKFHNVSISDDALGQAVTLSIRYINNRFLPDKAIDLIDETSSAARNKEKAPDFSKKIKALENEREKIITQKNAFVNQEKYDEALGLRQKEKELSKKIDALKKSWKEAEKEKTAFIAGADISETVSQITGVPLEKLTVGKSKPNLRNLEKNLESKIIGQKEAIQKISSNLIRSSSGISNPDRPLGSFLFLGPTGVGKTLTAKILAQDFFGSIQNLIRIDMSEFMERHNVSRLIGAPAGYVGYEEGGRLTEKIRHQPYSIVLFDEIEKAHPDVFNILLQILEDGTLTDAEGKEINFKNTIIILTSNLGTSQFTSSARIGFSSKRKSNLKFDEIRNRVIEELKKQMKPEIVNRLDNIIVFNPLGEKQLSEISKLELQKFKKRLELQGIVFSYSKNVVDFVAQKSLALDQGARLVRRNIQEFVEDKVAREIVEGRVRNSKIGLDVINGKIVTN
ncbi:MAG: ATP-dependent Clp protease ATP-binding subunit [Parcubacteria group bacterium]|jgi:ATP-dependent Clp protease ATP-binding subunit ClpC